MRKKYWTIFLKSLGLFASGVVPGYIFYYFFSSQSAYFIEKFKVLQSFFGINQYSEGMTINIVLLTVLLGNLISTICYIALGYARLSLPVSFISGFFIAVFLFSGIIRHGIPIPLEVAVLSSIEMLYRIVAISTGEFLNRYRFKNRIIPITALSCVFVLYLAAALYEVWQIF
jgi:hypothetical protein